MEIETRIELSGGTFTAQIALTENGLTPAESQAFARYGEPVVDIGGVIPCNEVTFTLPSDQRRFPSQFPVRAFFNLEDNENAQTWAACWCYEIKARLIAERDAKLQKPPVTAVGRTVETL